MKNRYFNLPVLILVFFSLLSAGVDNSGCSGTVFVSNLGSNNNPGTRVLPLKTISMGLIEADVRGCSRVCVAAGEYIEAGLTVKNGINLLGGYNNDFSDRENAFGRAAAVIKAPELPARASGKRVVTFRNITEPTLIEGFKIVNGQTTDYGAGICVENSNRSLEIKNCVITGNSSIGYEGRGGNIAVINSSPHIHDNIITGGFAGREGRDIYIEGIYAGSSAPFIIDNFISSSNNICIKSDVCIKVIGNVFLDKIDAVFVSPDGSDFNCGSACEPLKSISHGIELAWLFEVGEVRAAGGIYREAGIKLADGISLLGGYTDGFNDRRFKEEDKKSVIQSPEVDCREGASRIICAENINSRTILEGFVITGGQIMGEGAGILVKNCGGKFEIRENIIKDNRAIYYESRGGNMAVINSGVCIYNNVIINGFSGCGETSGMDIYLEGAYNDCGKPVVKCNIFTQPSYVVNNAGILLDCNQYLTYIQSVASDEVSADNGRLAEKTISLPDIEQNINSGYFYNLRGQRITNSSMVKNVAANRSFSANGVYIGEYSDEMKKRLFISGRN